MAPLTRSRARNRALLPTELHAAYCAQRASAGLIVSEGCGSAGTRSDGMTFRACGRPRAGCRRPHRLPAAGGLRGEAHRRADPPLWGQIGPT
ncbi:hypothetical protein [Kitasatospora aureofaciens]|uniref:hypothetical protein n=1 Tax=Kitasatospora aureofaciens TaxID=1894 RepID=UPI0021096ED6|nr:hypothetical protein [Kitasatospora aureofaciens]